MLVPIVSILESFDCKFFYSSRQPNKLVVVWTRRKRRKLTKVDMFFMPCCSLKPGAGNKTSMISGELKRISNGNRTEWSPIQSVIIWVIYKIRRPRSRSPICLITSMITDQIGRQEVLLPINHNPNKICYIYKALFLNQNTRNSKIFFLPAVKKCHISATWWDHGAYCPIT